MGVLLACSLMVCKRAMRVVIRTILSYTIATISNLAAACRFILKAVGPGLVVPPMFELQKAGLGADRGAPVASMHIDAV